MKCAVRDCVSALHFTTTLPIMFFGLLQDFEDDIILSWQHDFSPRRRQTCFSFVSNVQFTWSQLFSFNKKDLICRILQQQQHHHQNDCNSGWQMRSSSNCICWLWRIDWWSVPQDLNVLLDLGIVSVLHRIVVVSAGLFQAIGVSTWHIVDVEVRCKGKECL